MLEQKLLEVSSPSSPKYGKHLTLDEVNSLTAPKNSDLQTVVEFLKTFGIVDFTYSSGFIRATVPIEVRSNYVIYQSLQYSSREYIDLISF